MLLTLASCEVTVIGQGGNVICRCDWGWRICFQDGSITWLAKSVLAVNRRPESFAMCIFPTLGLAFPGVSDVKESKAETTMSFMTAPWKSHSIISATSHWLLLSSLLSVGERDQHSMRTGGWALLKGPERPVTTCVTEEQFSFMLHSV